MIKSVLFCSKCAKFSTPQRFRPLSPLLDLVTLTTARGSSGGDHATKNIVAPKHVKGKIELI